MPSITQNKGFQRFSLPALENLDLHCFWARFFDQPNYGYVRGHFSDDTLCYFQQGEGWVQLIGRERYEWRAPCLLLFRKTQWYAAQSPGAIQAHSMHFRCELAGKPPVSLMDLLDLPPLLAADLTPVVAPVMTAMTAEYLDKRLGSQWVLDGHLRLILAKLVRSAWSTPEAAQPKSSVSIAAVASTASGAASAGSVSSAMAADLPAVGSARRGLNRLAPALTWMAEHLAESPPVDAIAAQVGLSAGHFTAFFKQTFRITPTQYLIQLRIDRARRLLLTSELTVSEIAHGLGFRYPHYFIRQFKREVGQTPAAYRSENSK